MHCILKRRFMILFCIFSSTNLFSVSKMNILERYFEYPLDSYIVILPLDLFILMGIDQFWVLIVLQGNTNCTEI